MGVELTRSAKKGAGNSLHALLPAPGIRAVEAKLHILHADSRSNKGWVTGDLCCRICRVFSFGGVVLTDVGIAYMDKQDPETVLMWDLHDGQIIT